MSKKLNGRQARLAPLMENALKFYSILFWTMTSFFMSTVTKGHTTWCPGSQRRRCSHVAPPERGGGLRHRQRWQDRATLGLEVQLLDYYAFDWKISITTLAKNYSRIPGCTQMLWGHTSDVSSVAFHPSGLSFATCSEDKTVSQGFLAMQKKALMIDKKCDRDKRKCEMSAGRVFSVAVSRIYKRLCAFIHWSVF